MNAFKLHTKFKPRGDQPQAINKLTKTINNGNAYQTLLGVTGSGKTFTMASLIANINRPTLVISHNKTLAAQLYMEFKEFFPENAVEYFISYYDYYQPEAYMPTTDTYIQKDASINERINRLRLSATTSLISRNDVIVVASVSCIYNLGSPDEYAQKFIRLVRGGKLDRDEFIKKLIQIRYERNDVDFSPGKFKTRGDTVEVFPMYAENSIRVEFLADTVDRIAIVDPLLYKTKGFKEEIAIYPAQHFLTNADNLEDAISSIQEELEARLAQLHRRGKLLEAQRLRSRTMYDIEMLREVGYCHGIENYSRHLSRRLPGSRPFCLLDYFSENFFMIIDESHVTIPQIRGMYNGDRARKEVLVEYGFRLPSCLDNRPLKFEEFQTQAKQILFASATPSEYELKNSKYVVEQIIRPTGLIDPKIIVRPTQDQVDDIIRNVKERAAKSERILVTTLTKRMAEDLCRYLQDAGLAAQYLHSEIEVLKRVAILNNLRKKKFDCLVGVNLLREGLDLPEVSLVCVLDADKEGFLRSATSLIQVAGRAARNINGQVIMYADELTSSLKIALGETERRRKIQLEYNRRRKIKPAGIKKAIKDWDELEEHSKDFVEDVVSRDFTDYERMDAIDKLKAQMLLAAKNLQFEKAIVLRDKIAALKQDAGHGNKNFEFAKRKQ
ncbi:MAG: excinuclease ABC subunit UvrB [Candidatus Omnitrophica bacterium]|nr:excinuclease ABC subunit UvrB [Candidatus Omnitrophota bacterium]MBU1924494.1 excinuclease ABC subunit UvrB [Candidatus Omnitrophota bacterium]